MKKLILFALLIILNSSLFISHSHSQWIKQNWPAGSARGSGFLTLIQESPHSGHILQYIIYRTTNSGFNWVEIKRLYSYKAKVQTIDSNVMYIGGEELASGYNKLYKTTDKGVTWDSSITFGYLNNLSSFYFINKDTGWVEVFNGDRTTLYITTNGGLNYTPLSYNTGGPGYYVIYFLKEKHNGNYIGYRSNPEQIEKTTDGGLGWYPLPNLPSAPEDDIEQQYDIRQITFVNKDTGWVTNGKAKIYKTMNGGLNWITPATASHSKYNLEWIQ